MVATAVAEELTKVLSICVTLLTGEGKIWVEVNRPLTTTSSGQMFYAPITKKRSGEYLKAVGGRAGRLVHAIGKIPGVASVEISPYKLKVDISQAVSEQRATVLREILRLIKNSFFEKKFSVSFSTMVSLGQGTEEWEKQLKRVGGKLPSN